MTNPTTSELESELQAELQRLPTFKRFLQAVAKATNPTFSDIRRYAKSGLPAPWQNPEHPLHFLFRLEALSASDRQLLMAHPTSRQNPDFPWKAFADALVLEHALPLTLWTLFGFTDKLSRQNTELIPSLLQMQSWGAETFWRRFIALGARCRWALSQMRAELDADKNDPAIPAPIRLLLNSRSHITAKYEIPHHQMIHGSLQRLAPPLAKNETPRIVQALQSDAPHVAEIALSFSNLTRPMLIRAALAYHFCPRLIDNWLQKYSPDELGLSYDEMIRIACFSIVPAERVQAIIRIIEQRQPGVAQTVTDQSGNNLLWTTGPGKPGTTRQVDLLRFFIRELGISPLQKNPQGICYADLDFLALAFNSRSSVIGLDPEWPPLSDLDFWTSAALIPPISTRRRQPRKGRRPATAQPPLAPSVSTP